MTVKELCESAGFSPICLPDPEREVEGGYCGDLLSWVMGRAKSGQAWVTIMSNINIAAVATLCDTSVIILSEGVVPDAGVAEAAEARGINIAATELPTYEAAVRVSQLI